MPLKGYRPTEEHKRNVSNAKKGKSRPPFSEEWKRKIGEGLKGRPCSFKGKTLSLEWRKNIAIGLKGIRFSEERKRNISNAKKGKPNGLLGKHRSEETKRKLSELFKGRVITKECRMKISESLKGEKSPQWRGGISFLPYSPEFNNALKKQVKERDCFFCQLCNEEKNLDVHHINYCKTKNNLENLITLCKSCHAKTNHNREQWQDELMVYQSVFETMDFLTANTQGGN